MGSASWLSSLSLTLWYIHIHALEGVAGNLSYRSSSASAPLKSFLGANTLRSEADEIRLSNVLEAASELLLSQRDLRYCLVIVAEPSDQVSSSEKDRLWLRRSFNKRSIPVVASGPGSESTNGTASTQGKISVGCAVRVMFASDNWQSGTSIIPGQLLGNSRLHVLFLDVPPKQSGRGRIHELLTSQKLKKAHQVLLLTTTVKASGEVAMYGRCLHCAARKVGILYLDSWTPEKGFLRRVDILRELFSNFHGHVFETVTMDFAPFIDYTRTIDEPGGVTIPKDSMDVRILKEAARLFNFSFIMREPKDNQWGYLLENGSWTGTVGTIQRSEADFSMMLSVTWERTYAVTFTRAYYVEPMTFVMRKPGPLPQWQAPIKPFTWDTWIYLLVVTVFSGPLLWVIFKLTPARHFLEEEAKKPKSKALNSGIAIEEQDLSFGEVCLYMIAPLLGQPSPFLLRSSSGKTFCCLWWFFCFLATTLYRGSLIACLTVPEVSPTLDTLEELADSNIKWGMLNTYGSDYQLFRASTVPVYMKLFKKMHFHGERDSMELVLRGGYAFISWKTYFRNIIVRDYSDKNRQTKIRIAREEFFPGGFGWSFPKGSPYTESFDRLFQRIIEAGLIKQWMKDLISLSASGSTASTSSSSSSSSAAEGEENSLQAFTVYHLQGTFYLLVGGYSLAGLVLIAEIFFGNNK